MSEYLVKLRDVQVNLDPSPTVKISLSSGPEDKPATNREEREVLERECRKNLEWRQKQVNEILDKRTGCLADHEHPMRSYGAGVLARLSGANVTKQRNLLLVLHIRGSNRGQVWPLKAEMKTDMLCWKEFAGVTSSADELLDPRRTAIQELYEEVAFLADDDVLLPNDIAEYGESRKLLEIGIARAKRHFGFNLTARTGLYHGVTPDSLQVDSGTSVKIENGESLNAIVNYDILANALEISFVADLVIEKPLTGILSLAGKEDTTNLAHPPYMEDIVVAQQSKLVNAQRGVPLEVQHLLSVHGPRNLQTPKRDLVYAPAATLIPLVSYLHGAYSFENVLKEQRTRET